LELPPLFTVARARMDKASKNGEGKSIDERRMGKKFDTSAYDVLGALLE
jgi:hypothetical protein